MRSRLAGEIFVTDASELIESTPVSVEIISYAALGFGEFFKIAKP